MKAEKINNIAILVKDLEQAGKLFADLFGTEFNGPYENKELDIRRLMSPIGIALVTSLTPDGVMARTLANRGEGMYVLSLKVPNVEEASTEMKSRGIRQIGGDGKRIAVFHPKDLCGVMIELI